MTTEKVLVTKEYIVEFSSRAARKKAIRALENGEHNLSAWSSKTYGEYHIKPSRRKATVQLPQ